MRLTNVWKAAGVALLGAAAACDKDPARPNDVLTLLACPSAAGGRVDINAPLTFNFSTPLRASTATAGNIVFSDATTGVEIPGTVSLLPDSGGRSVQFTPSAPFGYDQRVRVRLQNLLADQNTAALGITVCDLQTALPPIRELFFTALGQAGGNDLLGGSLVGPNSGYVISRAVTLFRSTGNNDFTLVAAPSRFSGSYDVTFLDALTGFASFEDQRGGGRNILTQTRDGGVTFDTVFSTGASQNKLFFRRVGSTIFGLVGGGSGAVGAIFKYNPAIVGHYQQFQQLNNTGSVNDIDFGTDTINGVASTLGVRAGTFVVFGRVFFTHDGGITWTEVPNSRAPDSVLTYRGIAVQGDTTVYVVGGNGFAARFPRNTTTGALGAPVRFRPDTSTGGFAGPRIVSIDSTNPDAFIYNDVQFDPLNPSIGFIVGAQLLGNNNGVPRYQGLIFETRDGGKTWRRQGVRNALSNGAEFPRLNRITIYHTSLSSQPSVWVVGDAGYVASFQPCLTGQTTTQASTGDISCQ